MGWVFAIGLGVLALLALYLSGRVSRLALELVGAVLLAAMAGYAWTGSPDLPGQPTAPPPPAN